MQHWGSLVFYAACVALGAWLAAWPGFEARLRHDAPVFLALACAGFVVIITAPETMIGRLSVGLCAWGAIGASFGYAGRHPVAPRPWLGWLGDSSMAVYVLHHVPLLVLAALLLPLGLPDLLAWAIIVAATTAISLAAYRWLVEPFAAPRLLVGMAPRKALFLTLKRRAAAPRPWLAAFSGRRSGLGQPGVILTPAAAG